MRFRFSGHESFPCRYSWLPKAYRALKENPRLFSNEDTAMVVLGVGKNMVRSIKFWVQAFGVAEQQSDIYSFATTSFGDTLFGAEGLDPFLEDRRTLWLLHWKVSTIKSDPLFAWYFLINQWPDPTFSKTQVLKAFTDESDQMARQLSDFTKGQHFDIFLHTYVPVRPRRSGEVLEDTLDCPLTELQFISPAGERVVDETGRRETVYAFPHDEKPTVTGGLFTYCLFDFWRHFRKQEATLSFHDISAAANSVGQVFKLTEYDLRSRLDTLNKDAKGWLEYHASAAVPLVVKHCTLEDEVEDWLLDLAYGRPIEAYCPQKKKQLHAH